MTPMAFRHAVTRLLLPLLLLAGCHEELTQVVLVVQSDLSVPGDVDGMDVSAIEGPFAPAVNTFFNQFGQPLPPFPLSVGFQSGGATTSFSAVVRLMRNIFSATPTLVVSRTVTDVRFVDQQTVMLLFPMTRACACQGTSCPSPGNPECDNMNNPELLPFDPAVAPPSTMMGAVPGGNGGPITTGTAGSVGTRPLPPPSQ
jgi:hypothetical protein